MKNYFFISLLFLVPQLLASAGQPLTVPAIKRESDKKKDEFGVVSSVNNEVQCTKCGPALHSNYRVDLSDSKLHVFIPDNYELWINSKRCEKKCVFNAVISALRTITERRFSLFSCESPHQPKKYYFFDKQTNEFTFAVEKQPLTESACLVLTKKGGIIYCCSKDDAKAKLAFLAKHDAKK